MKIDIPLHAEHELDQLAGQFEHWRQTRVNRRDRIPKELWDQAVALARVLPYSRVATHLRLSSADLKEQIAGQREPNATPPTAPGFVEVPPPAVQTQGVGSLEVELQRPDGAQLRIHSPDASLPLALIVHSFLEAR